jgi:hypothetical protein
MLDTTERTTEAEANWSAWRMKADCKHLLPVVDAKINILRITIDTMLLI